MSENAFKCVYCTQVGAGAILDDANVKHNSTLILWTLLIYSDMDLVYNSACIFFYWNCKLLVMHSNCMFTHLFYQESWLRTYSLYSNDMTKKDCGHKGSHKAAKTHTQTSNTTVTGESVFSFPSYATHTRAGNTAAEPCPLTHFPTSR